MKASLLLLLAAYLVSGCTSSGHARFSDSPNLSSEPSQQQSEAQPQGPPPPFIYVGGEFHNPGRYGWTNGMTLRDSFSAAGGFTEFAWEYIHLQHWDGTVEKFRWSSKLSLTNNPALRAGDKVINPRQ